jgi:integration host factor subunit alpha
MTINKTHLKDLISKRLNLPKNRGSQTVEVFLETMKKTLSSGEDITISGFGKFCVKEKKGRRGRNRSTGEDLFLDGRRL